MNKENSSPMDTGDFSIVLNLSVSMVIAQEQFAKLTKNNDISVWDAVMRLEIDGPPELWFVENKKNYVKGTLIWSIRFLGSLQRGRQDISIAFDAATGKKVVSSIC